MGRMTALKALVRSLGPHMTLHPSKDPILSLEEIFQDS